MLEDAGSQYELAELIVSLTPQKNGALLNKNGLFAEPIKKIKKD